MRKTLLMTIKESLVVCVWIGCGAVTLWGADGFGLLTPTFQDKQNLSLQVDFPAVYELWQRGDAVFVDTRSSANFKRGHIPGAVNLLINRINKSLAVLPTDKETLLITYCGSVVCPNAYQMMNILRGYGYKNVKFFPRGLRGWQVLGHALETE